MKKLTYLSVFVSAALLAPVAAIAETFSVTIAVEDVATALSFSETTPMKFPIIIINGQTANGQTCYTQSTSNSELCPDAAVGSDKNNAVFAVTGTPLDEVSISRTAPANQNGLSLSLASNSTLTLNALGKSNLYVIGTLTLVDIGAIASSTTFEYEVVVSYS